jgi:hypothetical protein
MKKPETQTTIASVLIVITVFFLMAGNVYAHCDTLDGPVVAAARKALNSGDVTPVLKWVATDDEQMIRAAFQKTLKVRKLGTQAQDLADMYFFETLVRIHRAGEGAPYTGLKTGTNIDPAVALADKALESSSVDKLVNILSDATAKGIRERFHRALKAKKHADESVAAGREFVESYVIFTHYVEGLHSMIKGASEHHDH